MISPSIKFIGTEKILQSTSVSQKVNMVSRNVVIFTVLFIFGYVQVGVIGLQCYDNSHKVITCNATYANITRDSSNYTSIFKPNNTVVSNNYGCLAINATTVNNVTTTWRGCTYANVNCKNETVAGQSALNDKQCNFCTKDLCNSGPQLARSLSAIVLPLVITLFGFKFVM